jgi:hypothetical protein
MGFSRLNLLYFMSFLSLGRFNTNHKMLMSQRTVEPNLK